VPPPARNLLALAPTRAMLRVKEKRNSLRYRCLARREFNAWPTRTSGQTSPFGAPDYRSLRCVERGFSLFTLSHRQGELKDSASGYVRCSPYTSAVSFYDWTADR